MIYVARVANRLPRICRKFIADTQDGYLARPIHDGLDYVQAQGYAREASKQFPHVEMRPELNDSEYQYVWYHVRNEDELVILLVLLFRNDNKEELTKIFEGKARYPLNVLAYVDECGHGSLIDYKKEINEYRNELSSMMNNSRFIPIEAFPPTGNFGSIYSWVPVPYQDGRAGASRWVLIEEDKDLFDDTCERHEPSVYHGSMHSFFENERKYILNVECRISSIINGKEMGRIIKFSSFYCKTS